MHRIAAPPDTRTHRLLALAASMVMLLMLLLWTASAVAQTAVSISRAEWQDRELRVEGRAAARASVSVQNAANAALLATTTADSEGRWRLRARGMSPVPCRVRALAGASSAERDVANRPSNCGATGGGSLPSLSINDVTVTEGNVANFVVTLSASPASTVTVVVNSSAGTAASPADFNAVANRSLSFAAGTTTLSQTVAVTTVNDTAPEGAETFNMTLSAAVNATLADGTGLGTIPANDSIGGAAAAHAGITSYAGPATCVACHETQARQMHGSLHYQQNAPAPNATNINPVGTASPRKAGEGPAGRPLAVSPTGTPVDALIGINTYCGAHQSSPRFTCASCHVGNGRYPRTPAELNALGPTQQLAELANIDCLTCHQQVYKRFPAWPAVGGLGFADMVLHNITLAADGKTLVAAPGNSVTLGGSKGTPIEHPLTKDFEFRPAGAPGGGFVMPADAPMVAMPITSDEAARTVHRSTRQSCLNCHATAGGGNGTKRGDLSTALINPPLALDMHMSAAAGGANLSCASCHNVNGTDGRSSHRMRGRGLDLRANDTPQRFSCESSGCHTATPHGAVTNGAALNRHTAKVACQTCHIPSFAKVVAGVGFATEMARDWQAPEVSQTACSGRGGWLPKEIKASNVRPTYKWFDGTSRVAVLGESLTGMPTRTVDATTAAQLGISTGATAYILGNPNGAVNTAAAKIYPMKEHWGKLARSTTAPGSASNPAGVPTNTLIPHSVSEFFRTGSFCRSVASGLGQNPDTACGNGLNTAAPAGAEVVPVHTFQTINHGVEVAANALGAANQCGACHTDRGAPMAGSPARMQLVGAGGLGYDLREPATSTGLCNNCHSGETNNGLVGIHERHRNRSNVSCNSCHLSR
ncbi:Cytochrome c [Rubrivivax sp. A210]|uniref:Calx-beta domain-containing protein n=1 Tax=Rubrivivax sp. A210 TaxID=2772301 RepID=UPI0019198432|nr:Calx-beta domain-containing protein [Rubrivivax sp. A210]CAD5373212.1 Cytochrome c [Rubrivivax sp. A210]